MKRMNPVHRMFTFLLASIMVLCYLPGTAQAASSSEIKGELDKLKQEKAAIQAQIDSVRRQYNATANEIEELVAQKDAVDQEIALVHGQIDNVNSQIMVLGQMIADSQDELDAAQVYLDELNEKHRQRIRAMEEQGTISYWQVLFEANSFTDLLDRMNIVQEIAASDQKRLEEMRTAAQEVLQAQTRMSEEKNEMDADRTELEAMEAYLEEKRTESDSLLRSLAQKQTEYEAQIMASEAVQDSLMDDIAKMQKEYQNAKYKEDLAKLALQGKNPPSDAKWITPVSNYVISSPFGKRNAPLAGASTNHKGLDMACSQGTPIYATRAGTVNIASYQKGGAGYYVSISHGDGFASIYMHMLRYVVSAGQSVTAGQLIGYVGSTGNSTGPHLHFGVSYAGTYVNPLAYIS